MPHGDYEDTQILTHHGDTTICANPITLKKGPILIRDLAAAIQTAEQLRREMLRAPERALSAIQR